MEALKPTKLKVYKCVDGVVKHSNAISCEPRGHHENGGIIVPAQVLFGRYCYSPSAKKYGSYGSLVRTSWSELGANDSGVVRLNWRGARRTPPASPGRRSAQTIALCTHADILLYLITLLL